jgi:cobalt-precorrin-5B (C1)-methyltransferase
MAMGLHYTHASSANMDLSILREMAREAGESEGVVERLMGANTARHALEIMQETKSTESIIPKLSERAMEVSKKHSQGKLDIHLFLFDYNGQIIFQA